MKAELKTDRVLDPALEFSLVYALWLHLEKCEDSSDNLRKLFVAIHHLPSRAILHLLGKISLAQHWLHHGPHLVIMLALMVSLLVHQIGEWVVDISQLNLDLISHRLQQIFQLGEAQFVPL